MSGELPPLLQRERRLVEWVAQAKPGDPFPEPWAQASQPSVSIVRTLVGLRVMDEQPPDASPAEVARAASAAARRWLERNPT